jgi:hypothetical protein
MQELAMDDYLAGCRNLYSNGVLEIPDRRFSRGRAKLLGRLKKGRNIEIVDDKGTTHLSFRYDPQDIYGASTREGGHAGPGERVTWPLGNITILPAEGFPGLRWWIVSVGYRKYCNRRRGL